MLSVMMSDMDLLRQSIEFLEPKSILKKVLSKKSEMKRRKMLKVLSVDVKQVQPIYIHKHIPYKRKLYQNNMFMFIDNEYKIIGFLKGNDWDEKWKDAEDYTQQRHGYFGYSHSVIKNRKNMTEKSFHILMFEQKDFVDLNIVRAKNDYYRNMNTLKIERDNVVKNLLATLDSRLIEYKVKKYAHISGDKLTSMLGEMMVFVSQQIVEPTMNFSKFVSDAKLALSPTPQDALQDLIIMLNKLKSLYVESVSYSYDNSVKFHQLAVHRLQIIKMYKRFFPNKNI
jgi:hypothetical protein